MRPGAQKRAFSPNRGGGGAGGGYERTSETYDADKLRKLRADYDALAPEWRETFLSGLSRFERAFVTNRRMQLP